jgi:sterol desaturase/sphingolipid hydroxylase (fatty acid hydroxylase superfamily)
MVDVGSVWSVGLFVVGVVGGAGVWTLLEYVIHRFGGHERRLGRAISDEHLAHHARPHTFSTWAKKIALAAPLLVTLGVVVAVVAGVAPGTGVALGTGATWLGYELLHRLVHVRAPRNAWGAWARRHHLHHHFHPRVNHGVTTPLWDWVFGTLEHPDVVIVPVRQAYAFPWLLDDDGALAARWIGAYRLR